MRKEYVIYEFPLDFFQSLDDFMSMFSPMYTLVDSQNDRRVYENIIYGVYLNFFSFGDKVVFICSTAYDPNKSVFEQENIVVYGNSKRSRQHNLVKDGSSWRQTQGYYIPAATLTNGQKLVANQNGNTFMFSLIKYTDLDYGDHYATIDRTKSIFFGDVVKYLDFDGGFFYGGDFLCTYEFYWTYQFFADGSPKRFVRNSVSCLYDSEAQDILDVHVLLPPEDFYGDFWSFPWIDDIYSENLNGVLNMSKFPDANHTNRFDVILFARIDDAPNRRKNEYVIDDPMGPEIIQLKRNNLWAITMKNDYYVPLVCSIDFERTDKSGRNKEEIKLPTYEPLISQTCTDIGNTVNTLNNVSSVLHLYFMVMRDPNVLNNYSTIGYNDVLNFVNTFNISTNRIINGSYPVREKVYNCFQMGCRRSMFGMKGYSGIAFLIDGIHIPQEEPEEETTTPIDPGEPEEPEEPIEEPPEDEEPGEPGEPEEPEESPDSPQNLGLLDIPAMEASRTGHVPILNINKDGVWAYGGDSYFGNKPSDAKSLNRGSFIMKQSYQNFSSVTFTFCNDSGDIIGSSTWTKQELDDAFNSNVHSFNLSKDNSCIWRIIPFTNTRVYGTSPSDLYWVCANQNCGLIECIGNP